MRKDSDYKRCPNCGSVIGRTSKKCKSCAVKSKNLPPDSTIMKMLETKSVKQVADKLGVSVTTINHILLKYRK